MVVHSTGSFLAKSISKFIQKEIYGGSLREVSKTRGNIKAL